MIETIYLDQVLASLSNCNYKDLHIVIIFFRGCVLYFFVIYQAVSLQLTFFSFDDRGYICIFLLFLFSNHPVLQWLPFAMLHTAYLQHSKMTSWHGIDFPIFLALCEWNLPVTIGIPSQKASYAVHWYFPHCSHEQAAERMWRRWNAFKIHQYSYCSRLQGPP